MSKRELKRLVQEQKAEVEKLVKAIDKNKNMALKGDLHCRYQRGEYRYVLREDGSDTETYLGKDKATQIKQLCIKAHGKKLKAAAQKEIKQLEMCLKALESETDAKGNDRADIDAVHSSLHEGIRRNTAPSMFTDDGYAEIWQQAEYQNRWMKSEFIYVTPRGEKVRSKSEWMIASMLSEAGIPYRYEEVVVLDPLLGGFLYPDFTVMNKRTRKIYYWEHFGRMDDPDYINNSYMPKINDYYNFDILPGEKLLMTFESRKNTFDTTQVKRIIDHFLL